jgi:hypothetical protein
MPAAPAAPKQDAEPFTGPGAYTPDTDATIGSPDWLVARAFELELESFESQERIAANRRTLRDLQTQGALTADQAAWLDVFYRVKVTGKTAEKDDIVETRKAHEHARKVAAAAA